ncbi:protein rep [Crenobacter cavernae]|uniref:Uncharacterized protein n=1 Tax=Crenobacter cavernae TaxID=2290923 RepID=A0A345Y5W9_9NEIS|nr:protein rep [Crenobacter cavernae]AXK39321.1 hypothetical protein DWG20_07690 [Crenobacter cavernae]
MVWAKLPDDSGETLALERHGTGFRLYVSPQESRAERYALKALVARWMPRSRTAKCLRWKLPNRQLELMRSTEHAKAFYAGLQVCAMPWLCPVCSAKIAERRKAELQAAMATAKARGWQVLLLTLTVPHGMGDDLNVMLDQMRQAWRYCSTSRAGKAMRKAIGLMGTVRALEVTYGQNGFHPHFHVLLFLDKSKTPHEVAQSFAPIWQRACLKAGLERPSDEHGCRVDDGSRAADYVAKGGLDSHWGFEDEVTKGHSKKGRRGSLTPFDFLRAYRETGDDKFRRLFLVYADAFSGQRQLYWSNGLKALLAVEDLTDEEVATQEDDADIVLAQLTSDDWKAVVDTHSEAALLNVAETHPDALEAFLDGVRAIARACRGSGTRRRLAFPLRLAGEREG